MNTLTPYHAKYFAYELTRQLPANNVGKLTASLQDAQVDLNPHQVEAALFAFKSPLSKGAVLADEVGLGKTIEAGIILSQQWAEKKRKLLIICPSNLRKQWRQELADKFFLPSMILETKSFNKITKTGNFNPFDQTDEIVICSFHFAKNKAHYIQPTPWDLVIIDEAHRLRNVYKPTNKIGNAIKSAIIDRKKVLLTATPLQNSILELYGLVSIIDDFHFGDLKSFKSQYSRLVDSENYDDLRQRLQPVCKRTLRRQVLEYINYTQRKAIVEEFVPSDDEHKLYTWVSDYLQRDKLYALPSSQRQLMTLILRKLLASSTYAIHGTLDALVKKLEGILEAIDYDEKDFFSKEYETFEETEDEWVDEEEEDEDEKVFYNYSDDDIEGMKTEVEDLKKFRKLAKDIKQNSKATHLFTALSKGFVELEKLGANKKALIFTESRRTQNYLIELLEADPAYAGKVVQFNGSNNDPKSKELYKAWLKEHANTDTISGSPTSDKRAAIVDSFRNDAIIMVATEAAAEGINLQFCSLVVNYDLPWNPQRIEQRIGRCHRYGQKHDVVVVNFLNNKNAADQRVYELLALKFKLFDGVFGASDEVLGAIGSGMDFEKRIAKIYNECRTPETIKTAFDELQEELREDISIKMESTRKQLLENFDEEVREKLKENHELSQQYMNIFEQRLWDTTRFYLDEYANFNQDKYSFTLNKNPFPKEDIHSGPYMILKPEPGKRKSDIHVPDKTNIYRIGHQLAQKILKAVKTALTPTKEVIFDYTNTPTKVTVLEDFIGKSGWMRVRHLSITSFEQEDYIIIGCFADDGTVIESENAQRFFSLHATEGEIIELPTTVEESFQSLIYGEKQKIIAENAERNKDFFDVEMGKLDQWAEDMKLSLEKEIRDLDGEIKLRKMEAKRLLQLEGKIKAQRQIKELEKRRSEKRFSLYTAQDDIDTKKENLLDSIEKQLSQTEELKELFTKKWKMI